MSLAKVIEINAASPEGFDDAVRQGIKRASHTVKNISGAWVKEHKVVVQDGKVQEYRVNMKVTFVMEG